MGMLSPQTLFVSQIKIGEMGFLYSSVLVAVYINLPEFLVLNNSPDQGDTSMFILTKPSMSIGEEFSVSRGY